MERFLILTTKLHSPHHPYTGTYGILHTSERTGAHPKLALESGQICSETSDTFHNETSMTCCSISKDLGTTLVQPPLMSYGCKNRDWCVLPRLFISILIQTHILFSHLILSKSFTSYSKRLSSVHCSFTVNMKSFPSELIILLFALGIMANSDLDAKQTIASMEGYPQQCYCAQACFWNKFDVLGGDLNLPGDWSHCRADL